MTWNRYSRLGTMLRFFAICVFAATVVCVWLRPLTSALAAGEDKRLTVYTPQGSYSLPVTTIENREYAGLYELFQPLATTVLKLDGNKAQLNVNGLTLEFTDGSGHARIGTRRFELSAKAVVNNGHPMLAMSDLTSLLARTLGVAVNFHETARRLFIGNTGAQFSATLKSPGEGNGASSTLVLSFPAAVSPRMSTEGNNLRMVFLREPVLAGAENVRYNDPLISGLSYSENNGAAEIVVSGTAPLLAGFSGNGQIISVSAAPAPPPGVSAHVAEEPAKTAEAISSAQSAERANPAAPAASSPATVKVQVVIDPAHGGGDSGERFSGNLLEKDLNLAFSRRLRGALQERGILSVLLRDSDKDLPPDARSAVVNAQRTQIYISIHTSGLGTGLRVTSDLIAPSPQGAAKRFIPVSMAQASYVERSRKMAASLVSSLNNDGLETGAAAAPVFPLNRMACPAVAVEIAPPADEREVVALSSAKYQQSVAEALARAIARSLPGAESK